MMSLSMQRMSPMPVRFGNRIFQPTDKTFQERVQIAESQTGSANILGQMRTFETQLMGKLRDFLTELPQLKQKWMQVPFNGSVVPKGLFGHYRQPVDQGVTPEGHPFQLLNAYDSDPSNRGLLPVGLERREEGIWGGKLTCNYIDGQGSWGGAPRGQTFSSPWVKISWVPKKAQKTAPGLQPLEATILVKDIGDKTVTGQPVTPAAAQFFNSINNQAILPGTPETHRFFNKDINFVLNHPAADGVNVSNGFGIHGWRQTCGSDQEDYVSAFLQEDADSEIFP